MTKDIKKLINKLDSLYADYEDDANTAIYDYTFGIENYLKMGYGNISDDELIKQLEENRDQSLESIREYSRDIYGTFEKEMDSLIDKLKEKSLKNIQYTNIINE
jgi:hypothetical protein